MTVVAQIGTEGELSSFKQVIANFGEDDLTIVGEANPPTPDQQTFKVRAGDRDVLLQFHETCMKQGVTLTINRIYREPDEAPEPGISAENGQGTPRSVD